MNNKSMIDVAFDIIEEGKKTVSFKDLYDEVATILEFDDATKTKNIGIFYTQLTVDGRFLCLGNNTWDLKVKHSYAASHDDSANLAYSQIDEESANKEKEDEEEDKEYNASVAGKDENVIAEKEEGDSDETTGESDDEEEPTSIDASDLIKY